MTLVNRVNKTKEEIKKVFAFDIENTVLNRYTDNRVSEVYLGCIREIKTIELYETLSNGQPYNINDTNFLKSFLGEATFFRSIQELVEILEKQSQDGLILAYAHNLDYELSYILKDTNGSSIEYKEGVYSAILRSNNAPISIVLDKLPKVEFRCSYALTGYSIGALGKIFNVPKLPYNYETIRRAIDKLVKDDYDYNDRDVIISALAIIQKSLMRKQRIDKLPLTTTSEMNVDKETFIKKNFSQITFNSLISKRRKQLDLIDYDFYNFVMLTRQGGLTTLNSTCFNKPMFEVFSADITSSYPYVMCNCKFPRYNKDSYIIKAKSKEAILEATKFCYNFLIDGERKRNTRIKGWFGWFSLTDVKAKNIDNEIIPLLPLSSNKCKNDRNKKYRKQEANINSINGKVIEADRIDIRLNDVDYEQLLLCYDFKFSCCYELYVSFKSEYLSLAEISFLFHLFTEKQKIKNEKEIRKAEYMHIKGNINSNYGRKQMEIIRDSYFINNGDIIERKVEELLIEKCGQECLEEINKNSMSIDIPSDGCYISSIAKLRLLQMTMALKDKSMEINKEYDTNYKVNIIYADTDSLKINVEEREKEKRTKKSCFSNQPKTTSTEIQNNRKINKTFFTNIILNFIENYNQKIIENNKNNYRLKEYLVKFNISKSDKNISEILQLGTWDIENRKDKNNNYIPYKYFKSLGAKKYCYIDGDKIVTTIAGCSTEVGSKIKKYCDNNNLDYIETLNIIFNHNTVFDRSLSGRTVAYTEKRTIEELKNIVVDGKILVGNSGKMIENTSYSLGVTENDFIQMFNTYGIEEYGRKEADIVNHGVVFVQTENNKVILLESEEEIRQYFIDSKEIKKDYIYKDYIDGKLIKNK